MRQYWPVILMAFAAGCGREEITQRTYREITTRVNVPSSAPAMAGAQMGSAPISGQVPTSKVALGWQTPAGWQEQAGSGMRLVTFTVDGAECTITAFPGDVGGMQANVGRWLGQLGVDGGSPQAIEAFLATAEPVDGELSGRLLDFGTWVGDDPATSSMLAGVFEKSGSTVFVKLMGPRSVLAAQRDAFVSLCRSVK